MNFRCAFALAATAISMPAMAEPGPFLGITAGVGLAAVDSSNADGTGTGGYARVDYLFWRDRWFIPTLYSGLLITRADHDCGATPCDVSSQIVFAGARGRLMAPIPYVGPFFELGVGGSAGRMNTESGTVVGVRWSGATYHIPVAIGLALGRRHEYEVAFTYMFHPEQRQVNGAIAVGFVFGLPTRPEGDEAR